MLGWSGSKLVFVELVEWRQRSTCDECSIYTERERKRITGTECEKAEDVEGRESGSESPL